MVNVQQSSGEFSAGVVEGSRAVDDRMPVPQAAALITVLSLGLWLCIGYGLSYLF